MAHVEETLTQFDVFDALSRDYIDVEAEVIGLDKDAWQLPFTKYLGMTNTQPARSMRYDWALASDNPMSITVATHASNNIFTVSATANLNGIHVGDVLFSNDAGADEWAIVDSITDSTTINLFNTAGTDYVGTATSYSAGDKFYVAGTVQAEGGRAGRVVYDISTAYNYLQSFAVQIERSDFAALTQDRLSDAQFQKKQAVINFLKRQEMAYILGKRAEDTGYGGTGRPSDGNIYLTGGLWEFLPAANKKVLTTSELNISSFRSWLRDTVAYGSGDKIIFCGLDWYDRVWDMYDQREKVRYLVQGESEFFPNAEVFVIRYMGRSFQVKPHPGLIGELADYGFLHDPLYMRQKVALPYSLRQIPMVEYDKDRYKLKSIRGLKPLNENTLHSLRVPE